MILCIDPGLRHCGCAVFSDAGWLTAALLLKSPEKKLRGPAAHRAMARVVFGWAAKNYMPENLILEYPRVYPNHSNKQREDPNDLLELAGVDGALSAMYPYPVSHVFPSDWKGQVPKKIMTERIFNTLRLSELTALQSKDHNTLDAVGIGLSHLGRL